MAGGESGLTTRTSGIAVSVESQLEQIDVGEIETVAQIPILQFGIAMACDFREQAGQQTTIGTLLTHVRRHDVAAVYSLRRGAAEAMEAIAHGDRYSSKVVGRTIGQLRLPPGTTIGALVRGDEVLIAHDDVVIENDDHVILFLVDKKYIAEVERLFQVDFTFF